MTDREFLAEQSHETLEIMVRNTETLVESLEDRLFLLTGCRIFGGHDGMDGSCVDCLYKTPELHNRCCLFQMAAHVYLQQRLKEKTNIASDRIRPYDHIWDMYLDEFEDA